MLCRHLQVAEAPEVRNNGDERPIQAGESQSNPPFDPRFVFLCLPMRDALPTIGTDFL